VSTSIDFVQEYAAAAERLANGIGWSDLERPVEHCPGWTAYDVVVHLGNVHAWAATIMETGRKAAEQNDEPGAARPRTVSSWYVGKAEDLYQVLRATPPEQACWNFVTGEGTVEFWRRRQLHETTVHLLDLDAAAGRTPEVSRAIAADGVDEVLSVLSRRMHRRGHVARLARPLAITCSDTGDAWVVAPDGTPDAPFSAERLPAGDTGRLLEGDRVEGSASAIYRLLWKRLPFEGAGLRVDGDAARVSAFLGSRLAP
jgi:uncharacterized protein (TIGR03083 family)